MKGTEDPVVGKNRWKDKTTDGGVEGDDQEAIVRSQSCHPMGSRLRTCRREKVDEHEDNSRVESRKEY